MKFVIFILFQIIYLIDLVKSDTKTIIIDNEEYICSSSYDQNSGIHPVKNSTKTVKFSKCNEELNGYRLYTGTSYSSYYKYHRTPALWVDAREICASECAYLAVPDTKEELDFLYSFHKTYPPTSVKFPGDVLVGFNDIQKEGQYMTSLDKPLGEWFGVVPTKEEGENEDCGSLAHYKHNDFPCWLLSTFICEKDK